MIKHISRNNILTTPFVAAKKWNLYNIDGDDVILTEVTGSEVPVAMEFVDYSDGVGTVNRECDIALEQQSNDLVNYQEGISGSGKFYPDAEDTNEDGTYKRLVHSQMKSTFYNTYNDPTKIFGLEFIDFQLGNTNRDLSNFIRIFNIPQNIFGDRVVENTITLTDSSLDDNAVITDDGFQNLIIKSNLFSKVQEVRPISNIIIAGTSSYVC